MWTIGVDILIPVGRHLRRYNRFFDGHSWPLLAILIISIVLRKPHQDTGKSLREAHGALSILLIVVSALITLNGVLMRLIIEFDKKPFRIHDLTNIRRFHSILGVLTWLSSRAAVFTGAVLHREKYGPLVLNLVIAETCLFVVLMLIFDYLRYTQFNPKEAPAIEDNDKASIKMQNVQLIEDMRAGISKTELNKKYSGRIILIYLNKVFDLSGFIHPGGQFLFEECRWREVSRFLLGGVGLERYSGIPWRHSTQAFSALSAHCIGDLLKLGPDGSDIVLRNENGHAVTSTPKTEWILAERKMVSGTTATLHFKSSQIKVKLTCQGIEWMGRHYIITHQGKSRPYTNCTALANEAVTYRKSMTEHFQVLTKKGKPTTLAPLPEFIDYLPFCVKQYEGPAALSKKLVSADQGLQYKIEGPIGRGLEIPKEFSGHVLMIAGGTGILPFIDLLDFLLKKAIYEICKRDGMDSSFVHPKQDYSSFFPGAKFTFIGAFRSVDDFLGLDIVSNLFGICQKNKLDLFDAVVRLKGLSGDHGLPTTEAHITAEWLKQYVNKGGQEMVMICGPPAMQAALHGDLTKQLKFSNDHIIFV